MYGVGSMTTEKQAGSRKLKEAQEAHEALAEALTLAGIQLPAMDVGVPIGAGEAAYALVSLGECAAPVARQLASVIAKGAGR
jgi:hypothetical protein